MFLTGKILLLLLSPAVGSFLAVLIDRLPRGEDVLRKPSCCRGCHKDLRWYEMLPLLSYLLQRGRCRQCDAEIPAFLPMTEVAATLVAVLVVWLPLTGMQTFFGAAYLWALLALAMIDARHFRLPDPLTLVLFALGLALAWGDPARGFVDGLVSALIASGVFLAIREGYRLLRGREGLGLGDVKLMAGIGAAIGWQALPVVVLIAAVSALIWAVGAARREGVALSAATALPFGSFLSVGAAVVWVGLSVFAQSP